MPLTDQVAIVTGASRGIGRAISLALAGQGANVVVAARTEPVPGTVEETAAMVEDLGRKALPLEMNVTDEADVKRVVDKALETFGRIDILVNNAGSNWMRPIVDFESKRWELVLKVNAYGPFLCSKYVLPHMIEKGKGHILSISSIAAVRYNRGGSAYSASKAALDALTLSLAKEAHQDGICVNALRVEGSINTPGTTMLLRSGRSAESMWPPEVVAEAASYVCQHPFPFTGQIITIGELRRHVPKIDEILSSFD